MPMPPPQPAHIASPNWNTFCGLPPGEDVLAYDLCSLTRPGGWCEACCKALFLEHTTDDEVEALFRMGIFGVAEAIMGTMTGAGDPMAPRDFWAAYYYLDFRAHSWRPSTLEATRKYDDGACTRICAVLEAVEGAEMHQAPYEHWVVPSRWEPPSASSVCAMVPAEESP